jgi:hypothetical protein
MEEPTHDNRALAELFRSGARVLTENGLYKGDLLDRIAEGAGIPPEDCPVCTIGALRVAATGDPEEPNDLSQAAVALLSARVESLVVDDDPDERVADWSDRETAPTVIRVLRQTADELEAVA